jgi:hypothetical protein
MKKTTKKQFEEFKKWCLYYQKRFNLMDWRLDLVWEDPKKNFIAWVRAQGDRYVVEVGLNKRDVSPSGCTMRDHARHEMIHVLLYRLYWMGGSRWIYEDELDQEYERVTKLLEILLA